VSRFKQARSEDRQPAKTELQGADTCICQTYMDTKDMLHRRKPWGLRGCGIDIR